MGASIVFTARDITSGAPHLASFFNGFLDQVFWLAKFLAQLVHRFFNVIFDNTLGQVFVTHTA
jgi:hypothetical protein